MRYTLLMFFCAINLTASAQWWRGDFKKHTRVAPITLQQLNVTKRIPPAKLPVARPLFATQLRSQFSILASEALVMKDAQHNMRFREYALASYKFSELAQLYVLENRLSEAKWYYLQSILISKTQNDFQHTISSLVNLALIKADLGDMALAKQDLAEARELALTTSRTEDLKLIDKKIKYLESNKVWLPKSELRYAEAVEIVGKLK